MLSWTSSNSCLKNVTYLLSVSSFEVENIVNKNNFFGTSAQVKTIAKIAVNTSTLGSIIIIIITMPSLLALIIRV